MQRQRKLSREEYAKRRQRRLFIRRIISASILGIIVLAAASLCFLLMAPTFNIQNVVCEGNDNISSEALIKTAAVQPGKNIFLTGLGEAKDNVEDMEFVVGAEIKRSLPNTVRIIVTEEQPSAYFSVGSQLVLTDLSGSVIEVVLSSDDAEQIVSSKISPEEPEPTATPEPKEETEEDDLIWGYDDDGDPIYKINGGHYEFDDDGNRYFVDDSAPASESASPESTPAVKIPENPADIKYDELPKTDGGRIIYCAPVVYGVNLRTFEEGRRIKSDDEGKLESVLGVLNSLNNSGLLKRATKIDVENPTDVKVYIEDRLEILFGGFDDFEYKAKFVASVINENLSKYEHAILDFRDSKLYVRSADTSSPVMIDSDKKSDSKDDDSDEEAEASPSPNPKKSSASSDDEDNSDSDESSDDEDNTSEKNSSGSVNNSESSDGASAKHTPTPKVGRQN